MAAASSRFASSSMPPSPPSAGGPPPSAGGPLSSADCGPRTSSICSSSSRVLPTFCSRRRCTSEIFSLSWSSRSTFWSRLAPAAVWSPLAAIKGSTIGELPRAVEAPWVTVNDGPTGAATIGELPRLTSRAWSRACSLSCWTRSVSSRRLSAATLLARLGLRELAREPLRRAARFLRTGLPVVLAALLGGALRTGEDLRLLRFEVGLDDALVDDALVEAVRRGPCEPEVDDALLLLRLLRLAGGPVPPPPHAAAARCAVAETTPPRAGGDRIPSPTPRRPPTSLRNPPRHDCLPLLLRCCSVVNSTGASVARARARSSAPATARRRRSAACASSSSAPSGPRTPPRSVAPSPTA